MNRLLLLILLFLVSCKGNSTQIAKMEAISYHAQKDHVTSDLLAGIQHKIDTAFIQSMISNDVQALSEWSNRLLDLNKSKEQNLIAYWQSYLQYYLSIYYLVKGDEEQAETETDKGISWMNALENKNSEDYALLAMLQSFSIQFKGMRAMFISAEAKRNIEKALAIDSGNLRAHYVYASIDFYTPEKYGGGKEAEEYLLQAISLPSQRVPNEYLPSWGKEESYEMLIKFYIKKEKWDLAKKYFQEGIKEFPESHNIKQLATQLIGK